MIRHMVGWSIKEEYQGNERDAVKQEIRSILEGLVNVIPELVELKVVTSLLEGSTSEIMLDTLFKSTEDLEKYQKHPEHVKVGQYIRTVVSKRECFDYEI